MTRRTAFPQFGEPSGEPFGEPFGEPLGKHCEYREYCTIHFRLTFSRAVRLAIALPLVLYPSLPFSELPTRQPIQLRQVARF